MHTPVRICPIPAIPDIEASSPLLHSIANTWTRPRIRNPRPVILRPAWYTIRILEVLLSEKENAFSNSSSTRKIYGWHRLQGSYPIAIMSSRFPVYSCLLESFICFTLEQEGIWNFLVLVFRM